MKQNHVKLEIVILKIFQKKLYRNKKKDFGIKSSGYGKKRVRLQ